jgi:HK97 gp10 family phage protein
MKVGVKVEGGAALSRILEQLPARVSTSKMREALRTVAEPIRQSASANAPRSPGAPDLAEHIVISSGRASGQSAAVVVGPSNESRADQPNRRFDQQGLFVEFGTSDTPAHPFLRPAFDGGAQRAIAAFTAEMWRVLTSGGATSGRGSSSGGGLL